MSYSAPLLCTVCFHWSSAHRTVAHCTALRTCADGSCFIAHVARTDARTRARNRRREKRPSRHPDVGCVTSCTSCCQRGGMLCARYIDHDMLHWPACKPEVEWMKCADHKIDGTWQDSWRALEKLYLPCHLFALPKQTEFCPEGRAVRYGAQHRRAVRASTPLQVL
jgi:hypothetical protein